MQEYGRYSKNSGIFPPEQIREAVKVTDGNTRGHIINAWPDGDGNAAFENTCPDDPEKYLEAVEQARAAIPKPGPGRPPTTSDEAVRSLSQDLGDVYRQKTGRCPTRHHDWMDQREFSPFHHFVTVVLRVIPEKLLRKLFIHARNRKNTADYVTRLGIELHSQDKQDQSDE